MSKDSVLALFNRQLTRNPSAPAIRSTLQTLDYAELERRANHLAAWLQQREVAKGDLVPLIAHRSENLLIAILGILKCGAVYVPIDHRYPKLRKEYIAHQCSSRLLLDTQETAEEIAGSEVHSVDRILQSPVINSWQEVAVEGHDALYVIFTSGTTGLPKGVLVEHHSLASLVHWHNQRFEMHEDSRTTLMAGVGFDVSQWEIWSTLAAGACLHLLEEDTRLNPGALLETFARQRITHAFVPTVMIPELVSLPQPADLALRYLFTAGEKLGPVSTRQLPYTLVDYYGPTEATIYATCRIVEDKTLALPASIGHPVAGCQAYILDGQLRGTQVGKTGELYLGGDCLARGYLNNPSLTDERFIQHATFGRLYRTGDMARWLPDNSIQFLGRLDDQVKIRGNRVELGEIEGALLRHPALRAAVVLVDEHNGAADKRLVAFVVPRPDIEQANLVAELKAALKRELPDYMLPGCYLALASLPSNANGKTDKHALRERLLQARQADPHEQSFDDELQRSIAAIWRDALGHADFGADEHFFEVGGHSLLAAAVTRDIGRLLAVKTYIRDLYEHGSVRQLADALRQRKAQHTPALDAEPVRALQDDVRLPTGLDFSAGFNPVQLSRPRHILLTGATGFVGVHLLEELLIGGDAQLHCPIRATNPSVALTRLRQVAARYGVPITETDWRRVNVYAADLAEPRFGLDEGTYEELATRVDLVYHSASAVNFIQPYSWMKRDNVVGLREVVSFAAHRRVKPLILLSTISVYSWGHLHTGKTLMHEHDDIDQNLPAVITDLGYVRSKWVMEKIADLAASRGLPLMTFRLGYATCHSRSGAFAEYQWWGRLIRTCLTHGAIPDLRDLREGLTTVDYMVEAIAAISRNPEALGHKFNLIPSPEENLTFRAFFDRLGQQRGVDFQVMPFRDWVALWESDRDAPLYPLLSLFKDNMYEGRSTVELYQDTYLWDCRNVKRFLAGSGIREPDFSPELLELYLRRLQEDLPEPQAARHA